MSRSEAAAKMSLTISRTRSRVIGIEVSTFDWGRRKGCQCSTEAGEKGVNIGNTGYSFHQNNKMNWVWMKRKAQNLSEGRGTFQLTGMRMKPATIWCCVKARNIGQPKEWHWMSWVNSHFSPSIYLCNHLWIGWGKHNGQTTTVQCPPFPELVRYERDSPPDHVT